MRHSIRRKHPGGRSPFDYLRAFVITLVLLVHAALAYTTSAFINPQNPMANSNPVVNAQRWMGFDLIVAFGETFFHAAAVFCLRLVCLAECGKKGCPGDTLKTA